MRLANRQRYPYFYGAFCVVAVVVVLAFHQSGDQQLTLLVGILGAVGGFLGFLYSGHREEARIFIDLFSAFNERYDKLNDHLAAIQSRVPGLALATDQTTCLVDYFNLCAEEYLFYQGGYIDELVWKAWCRGMKQYLADGEVMRLFQQELSTGSYYGFSLEQIDKGAG